VLPAGDPARNDRVDYAGLAGAGKAHKAGSPMVRNGSCASGSTTLTRRSAEQGIPAISLAGHKHVGRYRPVELVRSRAYRARLGTSPPRR
jgi:hypothetical protein